MSNMFEAFDKAVDTKALAEATAQAQSNSGSGDREYKEVPKGNYVCKVDKLELGMTKGNADGSNKKPKLVLWLTILNGEFKRSKLFMNKTLISDKGAQSTGYIIKGTLDLLRSLEAEDEDGNPMDIKFESYSQLASLAETIKDALDEMEMEYMIQYDPDAYNSISVIGVR